MGGTGYQLSNKSLNGDHCRQGQYPNTATNNEDDGGFNNQFQLSQMAVD